MTGMEERVAKWRFSRRETRPRLVDLATDRDPWWALEPREWRHVGAAAATMLTVMTLALVWQPADTWAGTVPSVAQSVGTCHAFDTHAELNSFSDVRPPVPCAQPHQTETIAVGELTGELADSHERMSPEKRLMIVNDLCREPMRAYTGAGPRDELWGVGAVLRLPTAAEWAEGERHYRCELMPKSGDDTADLPKVSRSLQGVLDTPAGAAYRRCWTDLDAAVPCDQPHRAESVSAIAAVPAERFAGPSSGFTSAQGAAFHAWADPVCESTVSEFLGMAVDRTPYRPVARLIGDGHVLECGVAFPTDVPMRAGSLARVGTEPAK
jgi:hypothetical protein